ncbi:BtpA/SgcQ family protein [soil metagenome]
MFGKNCSIIGAVHVHALPGAAGYSGNMAQIIERAVSDSCAYQKAGVDALIIENMHDVPYLKGYAEAETTAAMAVVAAAIKKECQIPIGIQILAGANIEALAVAHTCELDFIRVEGFVFAHIGDEGIHEACAAQLVRKRAAIKADKVKIYADIKKKHSSHAITDDISLKETASTAEFFKADGVIVTGMRTGHAPPPSAVSDVKSEVSIPVLVGSGVTAENIAEYAKHADGIIFGTYGKFDGNWINDVDEERVKRLVDACHK